jgi:TolB-like protein
MTFQFGEFELSPERYELRRNGIVLHVEPLVFDLISVLAANPGRVLTREEIVERVWQGRAVSEATIDGCVKSARRALGDTGGEKALIRTVRGRGFEFAITVKEGKSEASRAAESARRETSQPVIAIFPLANHSSSEDDYFADGLTEDIITCLSRFRDLRVIAASSTLQFRDGGLGILEFCDELNAGYAVQGTVRRSEGRIRIAVQLLDGATAVQLWGERYDRELGDVFGV